MVRILILTGADTFVDNFDDGVATSDNATVTITVTRSMMRQREWISRFPLKQTYLIPFRQMILASATRLMNPHRMYSGGKNRQFTG